MHPRYLICAALWIVAVSAAAQVYYVDGNGADANNGRTLTGAWRTIQKAASTMVAGDTCRVRAGVYRESIRPANSGTAAARIVYEPYQGERVVIAATELATNTWTLDSGNIYWTPLAADFYTTSFNFAEQVFADGAMMPLARWPNSPMNITNQPKALTDGNATTNQVGTWGYITFTDAALTPAIDDYYVGAQIYMQPGWQIWGWTHSGVVVSQQGTRITFRRWIDTRGAWKDRYGLYSRYYLFNQRSMLDERGEWFHDTSAGRLYAWMPDDTHPTNHVIEIKKRDWAFDFSNRRYTTVRGFHLFGCGITTDTAAGNGYPYNPATGAPLSYGRYNTIATSIGIVLDRLHARYVTHFTDVSGHFFAQWGQSTGLVLSGSNHVARNCIVQLSAGNGISCIGRSNVVYNNLIEDVDYTSVECGGIQTAGAATMGFSEDHDLGYNTVRRTGRTGIVPRNYTNSRVNNFRARIHHNDISYCMQQDWDGGGIYTAGYDAKFVRIDHNFVHDLARENTYNIYPDWARNFIIDHNVAWRSWRGIQLQGNNGSANNTICYNNTIGCAYMYIGGSSLGGWAHGSDITVNNGSAIRNSLVFSPERPIPLLTNNPAAFANADIAKNLEWDHVVGSASDPRFVDEANGNLMIQANSAARDAGDPIPTYSLDGWTIPPFYDATNGAPDVGAFEYGIEPWYAGARPVVWTYTTNDYAGTDIPAVMRILRNNDQGVLTAAFAMSGSEWPNANVSVTPSDCVIFTNGQDEAFVSVILGVTGLASFTQLTLTLQDGGRALGTNDPVSASVWIQVPEPWCCGLFASLWLVARRRPPR